MKTTSFFLCALLFIFLSAPVLSTNQFKQKQTPESFIKLISELNQKNKWKEFEKQGFTKCAVFDADGTLWKTDFSRAFILELIKENKFPTKGSGFDKLNENLEIFGLEKQPTFSLIFKTFGQAFRTNYKGMIDSASNKGLSEAEAIDIVYSTYNLVVAGFDLQQISYRAKQYFKIYFKKNIFDGIVNIQDVLKKHGFEIFVASTGIDPVVKAGSSFLDIKDSHVRGTKSVLQNNIILPEIDFPIHMGKAKEKSSLEFCKGKPLFVFGDSVATTDKDMLKLAKFPVAVEPKGKHKKAAVDNGYFILMMDKRE
jgi:phosphoserine phosphatase